MGFSQGVGFGGALPAPAPAPAKWTGRLGWGATSVTDATPRHWLQVAGNITASVAAPRFWIAQRGLVLARFVAVHQAVGSAQWEYQLQVNGVDTAVVIPLAGASTAPAFDFSTVLVAQGDQLAWRVRRTDFPGGSSGVQVLVSCEAEEP